MRLRSFANWPHVCARCLPAHAAQSAMAAATAAMEPQEGSAMTGAAKEMMGAEPAGAWVARG